MRGYDPGMRYLAMTMAVVLAMTSAAMAQGQDAQRATYETRALECLSQEKPQGRMTRQYREQREAEDKAFLEQARKIDQAVDKYLEEHPDTAPRIAEAMREGTLQVGMTMEQLKIICNHISDVSSQSGGVEQRWVRVSPSGPSKWMQYNVSMTLDGVLVEWQHMNR